MKPLEGLRILDLNRVLTGRSLAVLGADVIKLVPPAGDEYGHFGPSVQDQNAPDARDAATHSTKTHALENEPLSPRQGIRKQRSNTMTDQQAARMAKLSAKDSARCLTDAAPQLKDGFTRNFPLKRDARDCRNKGSSEIQPTIIAAHLLH